MKQIFLALSLTLSLPLAALAEKVPAIDIQQSLYGPGSYLPMGSRPIKTTPALPMNSDRSPAPSWVPSPSVADRPAVSPPLPPVNLLSDTEVKLNAKEQQAVNLTNQWKGKPQMPILDGDGTLNFAYGQTLPSVICAPLYACDVSLEPGEVVQQVDVGDAVRWKVTPAVSGTGAHAVTHLIVKPTDAGLLSNMVVMTDRRSYTIKLVSRKDLWTPKVAFTYPEDTQSRWKEYIQQRTQNQNAAYRLISNNTNPAPLDFGFHVKGDSPHWRPLRVYTDYEKTYIEFPPAIRNGEAPVLVIIGPESREQLVNYRMLDNRYVVDQVVQHAALISGVGRHQERVDIIRMGGGS
jgi:P-type conjugative transfer protein TrbG